MAARTGGAGPEFRRMYFSGSDGRPEGTRSDVKTEKCPKCGSAHIRRIAYGFPGPDADEATEHGTIAMGGCVIDARSREWECADCNVTFNDGGADMLEPIDYRPEWVRRQQQGPDE